MTLGALVDLGVPVGGIREALESLRMKGWSISAEPVKRCGIGATLVRVQCEDHHPHRGFSTIRGMIEDCALPERVKARSVDCFRRLATAEAEVHQTDIEKVHFHEVGAVDAIVDIVGSMWAANTLGIESATASTVVVGSGTIRSAHGELPVPAPATALLLRNAPIATGDVAAEMTTPTGAAILTTLCTGFGGMKDLRVDRVGYGAGTREIAERTNFLRVFLGTAGDAGVPLEKRELAIVQTEIDDMPGELFGFVLERLFAAGCLDAHTVPVQMKKNRPGASLQVLVSPDKVAETVELVLRETSSFGVKVIPCERYCLRRRIERLATPLGEVSVKIGVWGDSVLKATPEYEDCKRIAAERGIALAEVFAVVNAAILSWRTGK
jgi:hypothetical protein